MKLNINKGIIDNQEHRHLTVNIPSLSGNIDALDFVSAVAYTPFINSHDHLVGNWFPRALAAAPYINSHLWVEAMVTDPSVVERSKVWRNSDGKFYLMVEGAILLVKLGAYKNLFSGTTVVQDHMPYQEDAYYQLFPIHVIKDYKQTHSVTLGNWWGGESPQIELSKAQGKQAFILHLGEGLDDATRDEFNQALQAGLIQKNTMMIHAISLSKEELRTTAEIGSTVCWCPTSNYNLIGTSVDINTALAEGVNVVIGTDSSLSGSINLFAELRLIHRKNPDLALSSIYDMLTCNAAKALYLPDYQMLGEKTDSILIMNEQHENAYHNLLHSQIHDVKLLIHKGKALYGDANYLTQLADPAEYTYIDTAGGEKFVIGDPVTIMNKVNEILKYDKKLPYLPF